MDNECPCITLNKGRRSVSTSKVLREMSIRFHEFMVADMHAYERAID